MHYKRLFFVFTISLSGKSLPDTLKKKVPIEAGKYSLLFPGGGQFYNQEYVKGSIILCLEIYSMVKFNEYRQEVKYDNITSSISKRNKAGWWMFFLYFYGFMDAIVEAHLYNHKDVMNTPIEKK